MSRLPVPVLINLAHSIPDSPALCKFPFLRTRAVKPPSWHRCRGWMMVWVWLTLLLVLPAPLASARGVIRDDPPPVEQVSANATLFIGPRARTSARLEALRVDATIQQEGERTWAAVQSWFRLQNPLTGTLALDTIVQGIDTTPAASAVTLTVDSAPQLLLPLNGTNHWRWQTALPGSGRLEPLLAYRVPLGDGALARFRYDPVNGWGRAPGSLRVTVRFPDRVAADQLILVQPAGYTFDGNQLTWSYEGRAQPGAIDLLMLAPAAWRNLQTAQAAAASPSATAADYLTLGRWYHLLARADVGEGAALFDRYYPQAMAALTQAHNLAPDDPAPLRLLADLYLQQAARDTTYRSLAAAVLAEARALGDDSPELQASLARLYLDLAHTAQADGSWRAAAQYLEDLARLDASAIPPDLQAEQQSRAQAVALAQAQEALARGDMAGARQILESTWGANALAVAGAPMASFLSQQAAVSLSNSQHVIDMTLAPRAAARDMARATLQRAVADARTIPGVTAVLDERADLFQFGVTIPFSGAVELRDKRRHLADLIAAEPDLALLHALLGAHAVDVTRTPETLWQVQYLTDTLDLPAAFQAWTGHAARYQQAIDELGRTPPDDPAAALAPVQRALWKAEAAAWQDLAANSEVRYRAALTRTTGPQLEQTWVGGLAEPLSIQLRASDWRIEVVLAAGAVLMLLVMMVAWLFWRYA